MRNVIVLIVVIGAIGGLHPSLRGQQRGTQRDVYCCSLASYHEALDEGFSGAAGTPTGSAISVRVLASFQPETELIIDKTPGRTSIVQLRFASSVWSRMTTFRTPPTHAQCLNVLGNIAVDRVLVPISIRTIDELVGAFEQVDISTDDCPHDAFGKCVRLNDATTYEVRAGKLRAMVTDVKGPHVTSENPALLQWIHKLIDSVERAESHP